MSHNASETPITHFSNCHVGIFAQLDRMGDLPALLGPAAQALTVRSVATGSAQKRAKDGWFGLGMAMGFEDM